MPNLYLYLLAELQISNAKSMFFLPYNSYQCRNTLNLHQLLPILYKLIIIQTHTTSPPSNKASNIKLKKSRSSHHSIQTNIDTR